jgi:hypothetical protein
VAGSANAARDIAQPAGKALLTMLKICRTAHVRDAASFVQNRQGSVGFYDNEFMPAFKSSSYKMREVLGVRIGYGTALRQMMRGEVVEVPAAALLSSAPRLAWTLAYIYIHT